MNNASEEQLASKQKYDLQIETYAVGVAAHGDPQTRQGIQKRITTNSCRVRALYRTDRLERGTT